MTTTIEELKAAETTCARIDQQLRAARHRERELAGVMASAPPTPAARAFQLVESGGILLDEVPTDLAEMNELRRDIEILEIAESEASNRLDTLRTKAHRERHSRYAAERLPAIAGKIAKALRTAQEQYDLMHADALEHDIDLAEIHDASVHNYASGLLFVRHPGQTETQADRLIAELNSIAKG